MPALLLLLFCNETCIIICEAQESKRCLQAAVAVLVAGMKLTASRVGQ